VLLSKLNYHGITGNEWNWFLNYLSNRQQCTVIDNIQSDLLPVTVGVPQGSILGPLLFIIFINDLPDVLVDSRVALYADDTAIMYKSKSRSDIEDVLNRELARVAEWMHVNRLTVNASTTKVMLFGSHQRLKSTDLDIRLRQEKLELVYVFKYLGMWFDPQLKWTMHIDKMSSKISQKIGIIKRLRQYIDQNTINMLYNAIVLPIIDYCCPIWASAANKLVNKIQILQNNAARITLGCKVREKHVDEIYKELKWMNVRERANYFKSILMYKCIHNLAPEYLVNKIQNQNTHRYSTRSQSANNIATHRIRTEWGRRTFLNSGASVWNNLPNTVRNSLSIQSFKKNFKKYIISSGV
jgi:hypothetical protein